jgi:hypothetical protein
MTDPLDQADRGIRGSLLVFMIISAIAAVVAMVDVVGVIQSHAYFQKIGMPLPLGDRLLGLAWSGSQVLGPLMVIGAMARIRRPSTIRWAIATFWLVFVLLPAFHAVQTSEDPIARRIPAIWEFQAWRLGLGLGFCLGATVYLMTSRRIARTFVRPLAVRGVFD